MSEGHEDKSHVSHVIRMVNKVLRFEHTTLLNTRVDQHSVDVSSHEV